MKVHIYPVKNVCLPGSRVEDVQLKASKQGGHMVRLSLEYCGGGVRLCELRGTKGQACDLQRTEGRRRRR